LVNIYGKDRSRKSSKKEGMHKPKYSMVTLKDIFNYPDLEYLINRILVRGMVMVLGGYAGTKKSIVALSIIKSVLTGKPLWGKFKVRKTGPILLVDEETPKALLKQRLQKMHFNKNLHLFSLHFQGVRLDLDGYFEALMEKMREVKPVLVVFDSLTRFHQQSEAYANAMSPVMGRLREIANSGTTVLVIHHHRKGRGDPSQMLRGSSDIAGVIDVEYALTKKRNYLIFKSEKTRIRPLEPIKLRVIFKKTSIKVVCEGREMSKDKKILSSVAKILEKKNGLGVEEIHLELKQEKVKVGENALRDALNKAEKQGRFLAETKAHRKKLYSLNPSFSDSRSYKRERETEKLTGSSKQKHSIRGSDEEV
jgi:RecA-family ATPase